jgi:hypothetical protein
MNRNEPNLIPMEKENYTRRLFILLPALAMMLGWGLRGHIGGGPFGAMIPGAMLALSLALLLKTSSAHASLLLVFGVYGIGIGGQMTYGQTIGFLLNPETIWWGTLGLTIKGAAWGLVGGSVFSLAFLYKRLSRKSLIISLLVMLTGMYLGKKLVNEPMLIYFSDPGNPRTESWAGLIAGAIFLLAYLKFKAPARYYRVTFRFALWGMAGGGLGFGIGGFWMVLGSVLSGSGFIDWWKGMEFTFGFLLGASLGYAAWLSRDEIMPRIRRDWVVPFVPFKPLLAELAIVVLVALITYWGIPYALKVSGELVSGRPGFLSAAFYDLIRTMGMFACRGGLFFILVVMLYPKLAWQVGITVTLCHAAIDLVIRGYYAGNDHFAIFSLHFLYVFLMLTVVASFVAYFTRKENIVWNLFLFLIWAGILISLAKLADIPEWIMNSGYTGFRLLVRKYLIDFLFVIMGFIISHITVHKLIKPENTSEFAKLKTDV